MLSPGDRTGPVSAPLDDGHQITKGATWEPLGELRECRTGSRSGWGGAHMPAASASSGGHTPHPMTIKGLALLSKDRTHCHLFTGHGHSSESSSELCQ